MNILSKGWRSFVLPSKQIFTKLPSKSFKQPFALQRTFSSFSQKSSLKFKPYQSKLEYHSNLSSIANQLSQPHSSNHSKSDDTKNDNTKKIIGYWYLLSGTLVFSIVVVGGLTRLTESGLSIVEWNLIKGMKPPSNEDDWNEEFAKYKNSPEFIKTNHKMNLEEFKFIFYMEWGHRMLGRVIGLTFVLPFVYFSVRGGYMSKAITKRSIVITAMICSQGILGWYMVKSGLDPKLLENPDSVPRVSQYFLAGHLSLAFIIYTLMLATALNIIRSKSQGLLKEALNNPQLTPLRKYVHSTTGLIFLTAVSGAFVAGLDAGLIYNEFPFMGGNIVPSDYWGLTKVDGIPLWKNIFENPAAVQFNHRVLGVSTATVVTALWAYSRKLPLPKGARIAVNSLFGVVIVQVSLGIATLIYFVPTPVAASHQAGSLTLLSVAIWLMHSLKRIK